MNPSIVTDLSSLEQIRSTAKVDQQAALKKVAQEFEAFFMQMMLKAMRDASDVIGEDNPFNSNTQKLYRDMHDQQLAVNLAGTESIGLANLLVKQLGGNLQASSISEQKPTGQEFKETQKILSQTGAAKPNDVPQSLIREVQQRLEKVNKSDSSVLNSGVESRSAKTPKPEEFVQQVWPYIRIAGAKLGVDPKVILSQAVLETGWGSKMIKDSDGTPSYNLFGIKVDSRWKGDSVSVSTLEFENGVMEKQKASFRKYENLFEGIKDYIKFIKESPRYQLNDDYKTNGIDYAKHLQSSGYATDPEYASKIERIFNSEALNHFIGASD